MNEHGGYQCAFDNLSDEILDDMAILYLNLSWEESLRKNRKRFNPSRPDSIFEHGLPDEKLETLYRHTEMTSPQLKVLRFGIDLKRCSHVCGFQPPLMINSLFFYLIA